MLTRRDRPQARPPLFLFLRKNGRHAEACSRPRCSARDNPTVSHGVRRDRGHASLRGLLSPRRQALCCSRQRQRFKRRKPAQEFMRLQARVENLCHHTRASVSETAGKLEEAINRIRRRRSRYSLRSGQGWLAIHVADALSLRRCQLRQHNQYDHRFTIPRRCRPGVARPGCASGGRFSPSPRRTPR